MLHLRLFLGCRGDLGLTHTVRKNIGLMLELFDLFHFVI